MDLNQLQTQLKAYLVKHFPANDGAHDLGHFDRVYKIACEIAKNYPESKLEVILPACYLHDIVNLPKNHPDRSIASKMSAIRSEQILMFMNYPKNLISEVKHAIECHSFSAGIIPNSIEAKIVQDADRLESLGAIGVARVFYISGKMHGQLFNSENPDPQDRVRDDKRFALDHFHEKLYKLPEMFQTEFGKKMAFERVEFMKDFEKKLLSEI
jgi:uncharacterized protein